MDHLTPEQEFIRQAQAKGHCARSLRETCPCLAYRIKEICPAYRAIQNEEPKPEHR